MEELGENIAEEQELRTREINSLRKIRDVVQVFGPRMEKAYGANDKEGFYALAREVGFTVKEIPLGSSFPDAKGEIRTINRDNSAKIGKDKTLYVATEEGKIVSLKHLAHDVGACLLGGKRAGPDEVNKVRLTTFNEVAKWSEGKTYSTEELLRAGAFIYGFIPTTLLLDAIVLDKRLPYRAIKYV